MSRQLPAGEEENGRPRTAEPDREETQAAEQRSENPGCAGPGAAPFRFDDPYWDEAFDSYHDPTLRTCCRS